MGSNQVPAASTAVSPYVPTLIPNTPPTGFTLRTTISTAGEGTWTYPGGISYIWVLCIGGGGSGSGNSSTLVSGGGGGGGGVAMGLLAVSGNQNYYVGTGGRSQSNNYSFVGAPTSFGNTGSSGGTIVAGAGASGITYVTTGGSTVNGAWQGYQMGGGGGGAAGSFGLYMPPSVALTTFGGGSNINAFGNASGFGYSGGGGISGNNSSFMTSNRTNTKAPGASGLYTGGGGGGGASTAGEAGGSSILGGFSGGAASSNSSFAGGGGAGFLANGSAGSSGTGGAGGTGGGGGGGGGSQSGVNGTGGAGGVGCIQIWY
jgi:hypothetical protein